MLLQMFYTWWPMGWAMAALYVQPVCLSVGACIILCMRPCPEKFVKIIRSFHDSMQEQVIDDGEVSGLFDIANGTKQGSVLAPLLFCIFFSLMLLVAFQNCDIGIPVQF